MLVGYAFLPYSRFFHGVKFLLSRGFEFCGVGQYTCT